MISPAETLEGARGVFAVVLASAVLYGALVDVLADRGGGVGVEALVAVAGVALIRLLVNLAPAVISAHARRQLAGIGPAKCHQTDFDPYSQGPNNNTGRFLFISDSQTTGPPYLDRSFIYLG